MKMFEKTAFLGIFLSVWMLGNPRNLSAQDTLQNPGVLYTLDSPYGLNTYKIITGRWSAAVPFGGFAEGYINHPSFSIQNLSLSLEWVLRDLPISLGGEFGKYYFEQRFPRQLYSTDDMGEISAVQTRTFSQRPFHFFSNYFFLGREPVNGQFQPYAHLGLGASVNDYVLYWGSLGEQNVRFSFSYNVGAGTRYYFKKDGKYGADFLLRFNHSTYKSAMIPGGLATFVGSVGLFYRW